jgi:Asp-tRNA(Asn)/Glu-tRNA(Gln) amidotransferase A subunit family amidase
MPKKITSKTSAVAVVSEQPEEVSIAAPVMEQLEVIIEKKQNESESEVETDKEEVNAVDALVTELTENIATMKELTLRSQQDLKKLVREIQLERKKAEKGGKKKEKKPRNGSTGLDNDVRVSTSEFRQFAEKHYQQIKDSDDKQILNELKYDTDGSLVISRKKAHQFVNAYVKLHKLKYEDNGRRIRMDKTLQKLFPDYAEKKEKGVVVKEENFFFTSVMGAISAHLEKKE